MKVGRNSPCWCGSGAKLKRCHLHRDVLRRPAVHLGHVGALRSVPAAIARPPYALDPPTWPMPAGQHSRYIVNQLEAFKAGDRLDAGMRGFSATLSD